jgi:hypothetical protein
MKNLNIRALFLSIIGTLSCFMGCVRPDPTTPDTYLKYPLEVKSDVLPDGSFRLRWNAIKSADFIEYQILKNSGDTVPFIGDDKINRLNTISLSVELARRISDVDSTFFIDSFSIPTAKTFLRVFAVLKDRNLSSRNVEMPIKTNAKEMSLAVSDVLFVREEGKLIIADQAGFKFGVFDVDVNVPNNIVSNVNMSNAAEMAYGRFNSTTELYFSNGFSMNVLSLTGNQLFFVNNANFSNINAILPDRTGTTILVGSGPTTIRSFARVQPNFTPSPLFSLQFTTNKLQNNYVLRTSPLNREAIALSITAGSTDLIWFNYDSLGRTINRLNNFIVAPNSVTKQPFAIASDSKGFITNGRGLIFNQNVALMDSLKLPASDVRYLDFIFSQDGKQMYALRNPNSRQNKTVDVYTYPSYKFERSVPFGSAPSRIFQDKGTLILVGRSPNNSTRTMIEKVPL